MAAFAVGILFCFGATAAYAEPTITVGGTGSPLGSVQMLADAYMDDHPDSKILVLPSLGSGGGIKGLIAGKIDIALSARPLKDEEAAHGLTESRFAKTAVVFATNASSPDSKASLGWIAGVYDGSVTNWPGGGRIRLVLRPPFDSDSVILSDASPVLKRAFEAAHTRSGLIVADKAQDAADALEGLEGSLGTSTLTQVLSEKRAIKALALNGTMPNAQSLADGSYPFEKSFHVMTGPATSHAAMAFLDFIRSDAGKAILVASGNLPLD